MSTLVKKEGISRKTEPILEEFYNSVSVFCSNIFMYLRNVIFDKNEYYGQIDQSIYDVYQLTGQMVFPTLLKGSPFTPDKWCYVPNQTTLFETLMLVPSMIIHQ